MPTTTPRRHVPQGLTLSVKRAGRALATWLPPAMAARGRRLAHEQLARVGLAHTPWKPTDILSRQSLASISDPESDHAMCPLCGTTADHFEPFGVKSVQPDRQCPTCGSLERHRLVWLYLILHTDLLRGGQRFLHIAPEPTMAHWIKHVPGIDYLSADLEPGQAMTVMDITAIDMPDGSFDIIYASHVLEHVPDDVSAMSELRRVLAPNGWAVLEVPIVGTTTREDLTITDPDERTRLFGQSDHVRMYGDDGEYERRLRRAGFDVTVVDLAGELGPAATRRYRLRSNERVYVCEVRGPRWHRWLWALQPRGRGWRPGRRG